MSSPFRYAPSTTTTSTRPARSASGGRSATSIRSRLPIPFGSKAVRRNPSPPRVDATNENVSDEQMAAQVNQASAAIDVNSTALHESSEFAVRRD